MKRVLKWPKTAEQGIFELLYGVQNLKLEMPKGFTEVLEKTLSIGESEKRTAGVAGNGSSYVRLEPVYPYIKGKSLTALNPRWSKSWHPEKEGLRFLQERSSSAPVKLSLPGRALPSIYSPPGRLCFKPEALHAIYYKHGEQIIP
ncbi:hypothetical protein DUI87_16590 [Hirundo rustica rustica]|uniref:Uncharacterized protein n=1 Tax=Hirundo rustica rustica TaxID=333673 RepID=A0A3M0K757_HIRRU|nr:hypothetical protein DUI87_16590 [Hirundo rustica rustica]